MKRISLESDVIILLLIEVIIALFIDLSLTVLPKAEKNNKYITTNSQTKNFKFAFMHYLSVSSMLPPSAVFKLF
jgi:hypothetical protein